ncbi:MAG: imidazole glycerol phosphate synthase subunit HisH [Ktedonobacterales bacterium]
MIVVVDYGAANLLSITRALEAVGASVVISGEPEAVAAAEGIVLPGVGAAGSAMEMLRASGADRALCDAAAQGRPLLGVCLGMQLFFEQMAEDSATGLGLMRGESPILSSGQKIPHMGWNSLSWIPGARGTELFAGLEPGTYGYFVHSYHCVPEDDSITVAWTEYGEPIRAAVAQGRTWGVQFHPEKSGIAGRRMLANWMEQVRTGTLTLAAEART